MLDLGQNLAILFRTSYCTYSEIIVYIDNVQKVASAVKIQEVEILQAGARTENEWVAKDFVDKFQQKLKHEVQVLPHGKFTNTGNKSETCRWRVQTQRNRKKPNYYV